MKTKLIIMTFLSIIIAGCTGNVTKEQLDSADYGTPPTHYKESIESYLESTLKDPQSKIVKYIDMPKKGHWYYSGNRFGYYVCANINAKNSYGGYTGFSKYFFAFQNDQLVHSFNDGMDYFSAVTLDCWCEQKPINLSGSCN